MFQDSLVESTSLLRGRSRWPAVISFALQVAIAAALIVIPLMHPEILAVRAPQISVTAPWLKPPVVSERPLRVETSTAANPVSVPATQGSRISTQGFRNNGPTLDQPAMPMGVNIAGSEPNPLAALGSTGTAGPHVEARPAAAAAGPMHISTGVMAGQLLAAIQPEYPMIARISHTEGTVVVQAVISKAGKIESAHVVSGPAVLQAAALQAVKGAQYRPYLLNGLPTEVETTVSIVFRMGS
jgi:protein TonB